MSAQQERITAELNQLSLHELSCIAICVERIKAMDADELARLNEDPMALYRQVEKELQEIR